ncbi:ribonucleoside-diphosphate reductase subunit alpha [Neisseria sp. Ec49-e6-T10]|uniref:ribonucleoside-diphosphate reductase subunit alpha n=1 Tax=Neisseria sp. Ec49-e6-T10 TaxID=3140744 RepID=UPI003EBFA5B5
MINYVVKNNGTREKFNPEKLNRWAEFAAHYEVDWSTIALEAYRKCFDGCSTLELHKAMIDACVEKEDHKHLKMAGRLLIGTIYKEAFGGYRHIPSLSEFYKKMKEQFLWEEMDYSDDELNQLELIINHDIDINYNFTTLHQMKDKYLITNRVSKQCLESPQFMFMGMAMQNMQNQPKNRRIQDIKKLYNYLNQLKINAPTPMLINMRSPHKGYASCCVYTTDDTVKSLATGDHIAYMMTCSSAGIGAHLLTRSKGDPVKEGRIVHQGKLPYYRVLQSAVHANMQAGRGGSATVYFNALDPEIFDLLALKNPTTVTQKRIRDIDYALLVNRFFVEKVAKDEDWILISLHEAPDLFEAFYSSDYDHFKNLYQKYEQSDCKKQIVKARDIALKALTESAETGRMYITYIDEMNRHTPFKDTIYSSNLCLEIALPTKPFTDITDLYSEDPVGEIGLCSLASLVVGRIEEHEYEDIAYYTVLMIDNVIELMKYPFPALETTAKARRSIGVGITNLAHELAKQKLNFNSLEGKNYIHFIAERHSFWLHQASLTLAKEKGNAPWINRTKYPEGWLPIDTYCQEVDKVHTQTLRFDWESLRQEIIKQGGLRHSVLEAMMPVESSSQLTNTTNGIYPVRNLKVMKTSSTNKNLLLAPDLDELAPYYDIAWHLDSKDLIELYAIIQKFTGQAISADLYLNLKDHQSISSRQLLMDFIYMMRLGCKTRYYLNSASGITHKGYETVEERNCASGACTL